MCVCVCVCVWCVWNGILKTTAQRTNYDVTTIHYHSPNKNWSVGKDARKEYKFVKILCEKENGKEKIREGEI